MSTLDPTSGVAISAPPEKDVERFWEKTMPEPNSGCILWLGASNEQGYGTVWYGGRARKAHRFAFAIANGGLVAGLDVMHSCDNPHCVNPRHLAAVPTAVNVRDAFLKGRVPRRGDKNPRTKIPDAMIEVIRRLAEAGVETSQIAYGFDVEFSTIRRCITGKRKTA
jgi:hypothetical protein